MSFNDPTDVESTLPKAPAPPALTPSGVPVAAPTSQPAPIQTPSAARSASVQLVPVAPAATQVIAPLAQTPTAAPQTPATTTPGTLVQS